MSRTKSLLVRRRCALLSDAGKVRDSAELVARKVGLITSAVRCVGGCQRRIPPFRFARNSEVRRAPSPVPGLPIVESAFRVLRRCLFIAWTARPRAIRRPSRRRRRCSSMPQLLGLVPASDEHPRDDNDSYGDGNMEWRRRVNAGHASAGGRTDGHCAEPHLHYWSRRQLVRNGVNCNATADRHDASGGKQQSSSSIRAERHDGPGRDDARRLQHLHVIGLSGHPRDDSVSGGGVTQSATLLVTPSSSSTTTRTATLTLTASGRSGETVSSTPSGLKVRSAARDRHRSRRVRRSR